MITTFATEVSGEPGLKQGHQPPRTSDRRSVEKENMTPPGKRRPRYGLPSLIGTALAAALAAFSASPSSASAEVFTDDFETGAPVGWTAQSGDISVAPATAPGTGAYSLSTPRNRKVNLLRREFQPSPSLEVSVCAIRHSSGEQPFLRLRRNGIVLLDDGSGRVHLSAPGERRRMGSIYTKLGRLYCFRLTADAGTDVARVYLNGNLLGELRVPIEPEHTVELGDLWTNASGPWIFDRVRIETDDPLLASVPGADLPSPGLLTEPAPEPESEPEPAPDPPPAPEPEPTPGPESDTAEKPDPSSPIWLGDFESGDLSQWARADLADPDRARVVAEPRREGSYAARFEVRRGDVSSDGNRAEVYTDGDQVFREGEEWWFRWSTRFADDFPAPDDWALFAQWKQSGTGSPPLAMAVRDEAVFLQSGPNDGHAAWFRGPPLPLERGSWHDWLVRVKFSVSRNTGFVEMWHNGEPYLERRPMRTLYTGRSYLKLGLYRSPAIEDTGVLWHDGMRIGRTRESVAP